MYSDNPLYFDGMCVIFIEVGYGKECTEDVQCDDLREAVCSSTCQCKSDFDYNGEICTGNIGMYKVYVSNIIYNDIFNARIIILASLMELKQWLHSTSHKIWQNQRSIQQ
jgi:EB module.